MISFKTPNQPSHNLLCWLRSVLRHVDLDLGQNPKLRVSNAKATLILTLNYIGYYALHLTEYQ